MEGDSHRGARGEEGRVDMSPRDGRWSCWGEARGWTLDWWSMNHWWRSRRRQTHGRSTVHWGWGTSDGWWESHRWSSNVRWGAWRRWPVNGGSRKWWWAVWGTSAHWRGTAHRRPTAPTSKVSTSGRTISGAIPRSSSLTCALWGSGLALGFKLVQRLLGGIGDNRVLAVQLLLWKHVHHLPHAPLAAKADTAEALALAICAVFVELHLNEVGDAKVDDAILDVLVSRPPGEVAHIQLPPPSLLPAAAAATLPAFLVLFLHHRCLGLLLFVLAGAGRDHVVVEVVVLVGEVLLGKVLLNVCVQVDVNSPIARHRDCVLQSENVYIHCWKNLVQAQITSNLIFAKSLLD